MMARPDGRYGASGSAPWTHSDPVIFTAGGLTSGIDLALHVVELYFGREVAARTARYMEYEGKGWLQADG